jgi:hypothetical protein
MQFAFGNTDSSKVRIEEVERRALLSKAIARPVDEISPAIDETIQRW